MSYPVLKRLFDLVMASLGMLLLLPVGLLLALLIKLSDGGPIFYTQIRIGQLGRSFAIRKFRSMVVNADTIGLPVTKQEDPRITGIGRWLRKTKLDELPQLWNVLVGEMSFVGPRPEVPRYVERYTPEQREILQYKPGITDMATLLFRNEEALLRGSADVEQFYSDYCLPRKLALNQQYARRASLHGDIWIILETLCPYWLGVLLLYAIILVASLWFSYQTHFDFELPLAERANFQRSLPWIVLPQLVLLVWGRQCRGLVSYFSFVEMMQTGAALGLALLVHMALRYLLPGVLTPSLGIIFTHFILSFWGIAWARVFLRFTRESYEAKVSIAPPPIHRVAIIGTGELGTKVALDLISSETNATRVVAFFDDNPRSWNKRPHDIPVIGMPECLLNKEWLAELDEVIVALPEEESPRAQQIGELLKDSRLRVTFASTWPVLRPWTA